MQIDGEVVAALEAINAPPEVIEKAREENKPQEIEFEVFEDNWLAVCIFCRLATQWRMVTGMAGVVYLGLDYPATEAAMRLMRIPAKQRAELFDDVCVMERAAVEVLNNKG